MIIKLRVQEFRGNASILKTEDGFTVIWPREKLPTDLNIGSVFLVNLMGESMVNQDNQKLAKNILNEILNPVPDNSI